MDGTAGNHVCVEYIPEIISNALVLELWFNLFLLVGARVLDN